MGAFEKFRSADKLFWDSSGTKIEKIFVSQFKSKYWSARGLEILEKYYSQYSIDVFDEENINKILEFHSFNGHYTHENIYEALKAVQKEHIDYVVDYLSYKNCLKAYYDRHGKNTEWLVKIFVERYDLDRFGISVEDVLDDVHKLMGTETELPSLKKNSSSAVNHEEYRYSTSSIADTSKSTEKTIAKSNTYEDILREYYEKYEDQVFLSNILEELRRKTNKGTDTIIEDLRAIRKKLSVPKTDVKKSVSQPKSYKDILKEYYERYEDQVFLSKTLEELRRKTNKSINIITEDLRTLRKELSATQKTVSKTVTPKSLVNSTTSTVNTKKSCEHKNLSRAIYNYNCGNSDMVVIQKELWALWRYNHVVYVPSYEEHTPPFDLAILPTSSGGQAYAFFTEFEFLSTERGESIIEMPFQDLLDRVYNSHGVVNGLFINPSLDGYYSAEYSIGLTADILKQICRGSVLI